MRGIDKFLLVSLTVTFFFTASAHALDVTLQWDANTESDLAGYKIYYDTNSGQPYTGSGAQQGNSPINMPLNQDENPDPNVVQYTVLNLPDGQTYFFAVTAYNTGSLESGYSNEVNTNTGPDSTPPVISNVQVASTTDTSAVITWTTDESSDSQARYGTVSGSWSGYPSNQDDTSMVTSHSVTLTGLSPNTTYYFMVGSTDSSGNGPATSSEMTFTTDAAPDTTPPVISNVQVTSTTDTTATIAWTTDEPSNSQVQYGTISGSYPSSKNNTNMVTSHSVTLTGLGANTTYYFRAASTDASGNGPTTSSEGTFTTDAPPDYTLQGLPLDLFDSPAPESGDVALTLNNIPAGTLSVELVIQVFDPDFSDEGRLFINGQGPVTLFGSQGDAANDALTVTLQPIITDAAWYQLGQNTLTFWHDSTQGFTIEDITLTFSTDPVPDTTPPAISGFPVINYANDTIDLVFSEGNMQNATIESNYSFSPSLLFVTLGGSDDITDIGNNTYRLSMASIPANTIFTMTLSNITDQAGNPLTSGSVRINDNDNDGLADDWEAATGVGTWSGDPDSDGLNNLEEYNNNTNPNSPDTDGDSLPDGWELTYGLDPTDSTGINGANGDFDGDGWTNSEEYASGYDPASATSPAPSPPEIRKSIPRNNSGITNNRRVPVNTSFAVLVRDTDGIDITDTNSITFTINDGVNPAYVRSLGQASVFRVVKLTTDPDTRVTKLWAVYDRSLDSYGDYAYDANVNIKVDAKDRRGDAMSQASYTFNVESATEHNSAQALSPDTVTLLNTPSSGQTTISIDSGLLTETMITYNNNEPVKPEFGPPDEIPSINVPGVQGIFYPLNLQPPTVFNTPVKVFIPVPDTPDVSNLVIGYYDGENWVVACDASGNVLPAGDGWMVPGSRVNHNNGNPSYIELQVYHFSGVQAASLAGGGSALLGEEKEPSGGCFIGTASEGSWSGKEFLGILLMLVLGYLSQGALRHRGKSR